MVLDTINENDEFVFKNTHRNQKKYTLAASDQRAPDEFFFIHIEPLNNQISQTSTEPVPVPDMTGVINTDETTSSD